MAATTKARPSLVERIRNAYRGAEQERAETLLELAARAANDDLDEREAIEALERLGRSADDLQAAVDLHKQREADREFIGRAEANERAAAELEQQIAAATEEMQRQWREGQAWLAEKRGELAALRHGAGIPVELRKERLLRNAPDTPELVAEQAAILAARKPLVERDREIVERLRLARSAEQSARDDLRRAESPRSDRNKLPEARDTHKKAAAVLAELQSARDEILRQTADLDARQRELDARRAAL